MYMGVKTRCKVIKPSASQIVKSVSSKGVTPSPNIGPKNPEMPKGPTPTQNSTDPSKPNQPNAMKTQIDKVNPLSSTSEAMEQGVEDAEDQEIFVSNSEIKKLIQEMRAKNDKILLLEEKLEDLNDQLANGTYVTPKGKRKSRGTPKEPLTNAVDTHNTYELLSDTDSDSTTQLPNKKQKKISSPKDHHVNDPYATDSEISPPTDKPTTKTTTPNKPITPKPAIKEKTLDSPDFILDNLVAPKFERAMKELNVNYDAKIVRSGKQHVKCKYEDRAKVRAWCTANNVQGITSTCSHE